MRAKLPDDADAASETRARQRALIARGIRLAIVLLGLLLAGIALAAWWGGEPDHLPFAYEGFD